MIAVDFELEEAQRLLLLLSNERSSLVGRLVLAEERVDDGSEACTSEQWKRAKRSVATLPGQIKMVERAQQKLKDAVAEARARGEVS